MIKIVDYGLGNIAAFHHVYKQLNVEVATARTADDLRDATKVILPGVGAFDRAIQLLDRSGMRASLDDLVLGKRVPLLGVCVGMQMLARSSDEGGALGLGWIDGAVRSFAAVSGLDLRVPHMGWNDIEPVRNAALFEGTEPQPRFYFLHSYYVVCDDARDVAATAHYGIQFHCAVQRGNIHGVQFHPEKSHRFGAGILQRFASL
jgi:glutamine amidotransferase